MAHTLNSSADFFIRTADGTQVPVAVEWQGETAFSLVCPPHIDETTHRAIRAMFNQLQAAALPFITDIIPAFHTLTILFDLGKLPHQLPSFTAGEIVLQQVLEELKNIPPSEQADSRIVKIPVCYDLSLAPDLLPLAETLQLTPDEIIHLHTSRSYRVYMLGFLPGFAYMGPVHEKLVAPRHEQPRKKVAAGSVGIAGAQTGIYPVDSPGGWQLIGQTPIAMFTPDQLPPCVLMPGDEVVMYPISLETFKHWSAR
ncbi:MAG: 5-oxoprolinase subunit PxpB [Bacteroidota bacterium]